jgi:CBS-domain-containing membrane protein
MKTLVVLIVAVALVLLIVGLAVETLGFFLGVAPVLLVVAILLLLLNRFRGRRIPR